jgi:hypothetical protein
MSDQWIQLTDLSAAIKIWASKAVSTNEGACCRNTNYSAVVLCLLLSPPPYSTALSLLGVLRSSTKSKNQFFPTFF